MGRRVSKSRENGTIDSPGATGKLHIYLLLPLLRTHLVKDMSGMPRPNTRGKPAMSVVLTPIRVLHHDPQGGASGESRTHVVGPQADAKRRHLLHASGWWVGEERVDQEGLAFIIT